MLKRIALFVATNILVIATISVISSSFGINHYLVSNGFDITRLAIFCLLWGFFGSFISLFFSKIIAKMMLGIVIINPQTATRDELFLIDMIYELAKRAGLKTMPEIGIYHSQELNAFATGPSKKKSLIAISSGLINSMPRDEIEAVLAHEVAHIANGDMVTMTLIQGVINSFALYLSRVCAYVISIALARGEEPSSELSYWVYNLLTFMFDILFTLLGSILVAFYSRRREYRADAGGAQLVGRDVMVAALKRLQTSSPHQDEYHAPALAAFKIYQHQTWLQLFSTHPSIEKRIEKLVK